MTQHQRNERILELLNLKTQRGAVSKRAAREVLMSDGIYTRKGELKVTFGGVRKKAKSAA